MIPVMCIVQKEQVSSEVGEALRADIAQFTLQKFNQSAKIDWIAVAQGDGFTAGAPSTSLILSLNANEPLSTVRRIELLKALTALVRRHTGLSANEIVTSVRNPQD